MHINQPKRSVPKLSAQALAVIAFVLVACALPAQARSSADGIGSIALTAMPNEARSVYVAIQKGGPFKYDRDGVVFGNYEHLLPAKPRGYYHEYTVPTAGAHNRGARRIVCGGTKTPPEACYYSDDHYQSFRRIRE